MEKTLTVLRSGGNVALVNPALDDHPELVAEAAGAASLSGHAVFRTSGSTGDPKYVCLSLGALTTSAGAVNRLLGVEGGDRWLNALPRFHVGGFGVELRAHLAGCGCDSLEGKWNPSRFVDRCRETGATMTALVPTQLHDLAAAGHECPEFLRVVLAGGGWLDPRTWSTLRGLGWPVRMTYGMTEACSQVATDPGGGKMRILPIWETRLHEGGQLAIRGAALLTGYLEREGGAFRFRNPVDDAGWFLTRDLVRIEGQTLEFMGRIDRIVKVMGELVDLDALERHVGATAGFEPQQFAVIAIREARRGFALKGVWTGNAPGDPEALLERANASLPGFERLSDLVRVPEFPRTGAGKVDRRRLEEHVQALAAPAREKTSEA